MPCTGVSKMHSNRIILFFIETGKITVTVLLQFEAVNNINLYKIHITWISSYFWYTLKIFT